MSLSKTEKVRFVRVRFVTVLFRRHVVGSTDAGGGKVDLFVEHFGDAEISEFDGVVGDEDVGSFEVTVEDAFVVHVEDG